MSVDYTPDEPIVAIATALAPSALAVIRLSGKGCIELLSKNFSRPKALLSAEGNTIVYGWIVDKDNQKVDEVLVSVFKSPKSYTGEDMAEVSCHGGVCSVSAVFNLLLKAGFRNAHRGEFTFRAFINGKTDLTKSEAVKELIESKTDFSRNLAIGRLSGNLFDEIKKIKEKIISTIAAIEVEIEYPEDEQNFSELFDSSLLEDVKESLQILSNSWKSQKLYQDGARVILCGKTNAGKSSLFNALLKEERAIVSDIEGTTRDWLESWVSFDGIPARLFDTAGLRETDDVIEEKGVQMTKDLSQTADIIIYLVDGTKSDIKDDIEFIQKNQKAIPIIKVINKIDKIDKNTKFLSDKTSDEIPDNVRISAKTGQGISDLISVVKNILLGTKTSEREQAGLGSERQKTAVDNALDSVNHALKISLADYALDAVVQDLEDALFYLGEIIGDVNPDDILENIFSNFCVGK
ncbi:MAG: tRNA uridine-5-carboxymethylaminomethyl(34) synthesis GTPase MnmE [Treponemataceae bacterium]